MNTVIVTSNYLVALVDEAVLVDSSGGSITITLPGTHILGTRVIIKDKEGTTDTDPITITSADGDLIDGLTTFTLTVPYQAVSLHSTGTDWSIV